MANTITDTEACALVVRALEAARRNDVAEALKLLVQADGTGVLDSALEPPALGTFHRQALTLATRNQPVVLLSQDHLVAAITSLAANIGAIPAMTVKVGDRGYTRSYEGVRVRTVVISAVCPQCGGPRGEKLPGRIIEDGEYYWVHNWDNPCGHADMYDAVLREAGRHPWLGIPE